MAGYCMLILFLALGTGTAFRLPARAGTQARIWLGLSLGMAEMMWFPSLFAFFTGFTALAQYLAMALVALLFGAVYFLMPRPRPARPASAPPARLTLILVVPFALLSMILQYTHTLQNIDGALYVGQSTYGDLCLHLGIATGLRGAAYPPEYTLLPGTLLGYPFLFDALSASMLVLGSDLAPAFTVPGTVAMALVFWGFVLVAWEMTRDRRAVAISYLLTFLNGGLGFLYLLDGWPQDLSALYECFFGYYMTPTNMPDLNLRWSNVICDMMLPQRTILAGWTMLFPALYMLIRALRSGKRGWFVALGLWAGAMPMVHTHSFLALGLLSAGCMAGAVWRSAGAARKAACVNFLIYAAVAAALALPQLITWTFPQTIGGGSLGLWFNWVNAAEGGGLIDGYFWFWIKNVGIVYLLLVPAALNMGRSLRPMALGALLIYLAAECVRFQPNIYDNNKLFYVAFFVMTPAVGRFLSRVWDRLRGLRGRAILAGVFLCVCLLSGSMTVAREAISSYQIFSGEEARAAAYVDKNAARDAVFLTGSQHNNALAALAGRRLVCGTGQYLFFHGVDYARQQAAAARMYETPGEARALFAQYGVAYVYLSSYERGQFAVDEEALRAMFPVWYEDGDVTILAVRADG